MFLKNDIVRNHILFIYLLSLNIPFRGVVQKYPNSSWEVDALSPEILSNLLHTEIESMIDMSKFREICKIEQDWKEKLFDLAEEYVN